MLLRNLCTGLFPLHWIGFKAASQPPGFPLQNGTTFTQIPVKQSTYTHLNGSLKAVAGWLERVLHSWGCASVLLCLYTCMSWKAEKHSYSVPAGVLTLEPTLMRKASRALTQPRWMLSRDFFWICRLQGAEVEQSQEGKRRMGAREDWSTGSWRRKAEEGW